MSEEFLNVENLGASGGAATPDADKPGHETIFELNLKAKEFGDAVNSLEPLVKLETEPGNNISHTTLVSANTSSSNIRSTSSSRRKSSKRKRKNRRRRQKNAVASTQYVLYEASDGGTGNTVTFEDTREDSGTDIDTGGEKESETEDKPLESVNPTEEPSVIIFEVKTSLDGTSRQPEERSSQSDNKNRYKEDSGPTHSVDTLLQIAKDRILTGILKSPGDSFQSRDSREFQFNPNATEFTLPDSDERDLVMAVPPCSPSSIHNFKSCTQTGHINSIMERPKSGPRSVRFDEKPPEVRSLEGNLESKLEIEALATAINELHKAQEQLKTIETSKSEDSLSQNVNRESTSSSIGSSSATSLDSTPAFLLKGNSSNEDLVESITYHFPSREALSDSSEPPITHSHSSIDIESFRETIKEFKLQNPEETEFLGEQLESIISKSVDKFSSLMERCTESELVDSRLSPTVYEEVNVSDPVLTLNENEPTLHERRTGVDNAGAIEEFDFHIKLPRHRQDSNVQIDLISSTSIGENISLINVDSDENFELPLEPDSSISMVTYPQKTLSEPVIETISMQSSCMIVEQESLVETAISKGSCDVVNEEISRHATESTLMEVGALTVRSNIQESSARYLNLHESTKREEIWMNETITFEIPSQTVETEIPLSDFEVKVVVTNTSKLQPVEVFSIHLPQERDEQLELEAISSLHNLNNNAPNNVESDVDSEPPRGENEIRKERGDFFDTETESDFPWLPERKASLAKVLEEKQLRSNSVGDSNNKSGKGRDKNDEESQGCNCAKMCIIS